MGYTLITGASGGIGCELAKEFARNGHNLILVARNEQKLGELRAELETNFGVDVLVAARDLAVPDAAAALYAETQKQGLAVDTLINNAGFGDAAPFLESDWARQSEMVQLNIVALMQLTYLYGREMKAAGEGKILNLSSVAAFLAGPNMSVYYASKSFVLSFSQAVAEELRGSGVTVTVLCPGPTKTGFEQAAQMKNSTMFTFMKAATPRAVAQKAYRAMMAGRKVVYHSPQTYLVNLGTRIAPRSLAAKMARKINGT